MAGGVVAGISRVHSPVVLGYAMLNVLPELLHRAVGVLVVDWRRRTGLLRGVQARRSWSGSSRRHDVAGSQARFH